MSPRRNRIQKVVDLREKELDQRVAKLAGHRAAEAQAMSAEQQKKLELELASDSRLKLAATEATLSAKSWVEANEWLAAQRLRHEKARLDVARAQLETRSAQGAVMSARADLKKVELLSTRIEKQEQAQTRKLERKLEDELSSLRFRLSNTDVRK